MKTDQEILALAQPAIDAVLRRIRDNPTIRFEMGVGSQTFTDLTAVSAALHNMPVDRVRESIIPGSSEFCR